MSSKQTTLTEDIVAAARGVFAVVRGDRRTIQAFDFSQRGLVTSFLVLIAVTAVQAVLPLLVGAPQPPGALTRALLATAIVYAVQMGAAGIVLRSMGRIDGFQPYVTAVNWATAFLTVLALVLILVQVDALLVLIITGAVALLAQINIARLVVTLAPVQIVILMVAQLIAGFFAMVLAGSLLLLSPEELDAISAAANTVPS